MTTTASPSTYEELEAQIAAAAPEIAAIREQMSRVVVGQHALVERLLVALLAGGHVLLESVPGLAKTTTIHALASTLHARFSRIQFTPDLLPADIVGTLIYNMQEAQYSTRLGPIFANIVLADEINRAPAKVQSALLEAMQEHQVTIGQETYPLPAPFLVMATQNPIEQEGTYPLPEAQVDRFMLKTVIDYPSDTEELEILERMARTGSIPRAEPVLHPDRILEMRTLCDLIYIDPAIKEYLVALVVATRRPENYVKSLARVVRAGASPRATINLTLASRARAFLHGRAHVTPDDVRALAPDILCHRILPTFEAEAEGISSKKIVETLMKVIPVP